MTSLIAWIAIASFHPGAEAAGKKKPADPGSGLTTPAPVRKVILKDIASKPFQLPNGSTIDLTADLATLALTAVTSSGEFSVVESSEGAECEQVIEIRGALSTFDMNTASGTVEFGYNSDGAIANSGSVTGKLTVNVGTIAADLTVWVCSKGVCASVLADYATHLLAGTELSFTVDWDAVKTSSSLVYSTPVGGIIRKILDKTLERLATGKDFADLPWHARVLEVDSAKGTLFMGAGSQAGIGLSQAFALYGADSSGGACDVWKPIAYGHTTRIDARSSLLSLDETLEDRAPAAGDVVLVREVATESARAEAVEISPLRVSDSGRLAQGSF